MGRALSITANDIVKMFEQDREACRRLAELLAPDIARSVLQEVATKQDIEKLRQEFEKLRSDMKQEFEKFKTEIRQEVEKLRSDFNEFRQETSEIIKEINGLRREISELKEEVHGLREEIGVLRERVARVEGVLSLLVKVFIAFNVPLLIAVIGILLKMVFIP